MVQPLITRNIPADLLTANHYILGQVKVSNSGLMGVLSDITLSHIEVNDASIARIVKPDKVINYVSTLWAAKEQIVAVCLNKREYVGSTTLARGGYTRVVQYPVQLTTPIYEIQATLEWAGRFDFSIIKTEGSNPFIVLYDVTLIASLFPALQINSPAVLLNRRYLDTLATMKRSASES